MKYGIRAGRTLPRPGIKGSLWTSVAARCSSVRFAVDRRPQERHRTILGGAFDIESACGRHPGGPKLRL